MRRAVVMMVKGKSVKVEVSRWLSIQQKRKKALGFVTCGEPFGAKCDGERVGRGNRLLYMDGNSHMMFYECELTRR